MVNAKVTSEWQQLGKTFRVRLTYDLTNGQLGWEWLPHWPTVEELRGLLADYQQARNAFLTDVCPQHGISITLAEVPF